MKTSYILFVMIGGLALLSGCISSPPSETTATTATTTATTIATRTPTVMIVANNQLGPVLVDSSGMTLYTFNNDAPGLSNCYGGCAVNWPPLLAGGNLVAGDNVKGRLGMFGRTDGGSQVTYDDKPLYHYLGDKSPGDVKGQGLNGLWFVVPAGGVDCSTDSDCMSSSCCHATSCVRNYQRVCNLLCTQSCEGPLDCGKGRCGCVGGKCAVIPMPTTTLPALTTTLSSTQATSTQATSTQATSTQATSTQVTTTKASATTTTVVRTTTTKMPTTTLYYSSYY
jgi:predicted lipoprotein with Yx(FWY)xxD motif